MQKYKKKEKKIENVWTDPAKKLLITTMMEVRILNDQR